MLGEEMGWMGKDCCIGEELVGFLSIDTCLVIRNNCFVGFPAELKYPSSTP